MTKYANTHITISSITQKILTLDVQQRPQIEACGILLGSIDSQGNWHAEQAQPLRNRYNSAVYFEFEPEELLEAELRYPGQIIGVYHSHPTGYAEASSTDRENMKRVNTEQDIPWVWLILRGPFQQHAHQELVATAIMAYHHDAKQGLQKVHILLENPSNTDRADSPLGEK